ncbi:MAG: sigma-70 family RNA polymerase sigma factor [Bacteroidota bacterium]
MKQENKQDLEEQAIVEQILAGDTALFRELADRYKDVSYSLICSMVPDATEAEDILQDAFVKAFRHLHTFRFDARFSSWLYRIVLRSCYSAIKKQKKKMASLSRLSSEDRPTILEEYDPMRLEERRIYINQILTSMNPKEALVLRLHYLGEQKIHEIATITGLKPSNIKVLLHRGRKSFRSQLDSLLGQEKHHLL